MTFVNDLENRRTIDPETGAYLICDKVLAHLDEPGLHEFSFYWQGERIKLIAQESISNTENPGPNEKSDFHWKFFQVGVPKHMKDQKEKIINMIKEAFKIYGSGRGPRFEKRVTAEFMPP
jgi:hypothetical protein